MRDLLVHVNDKVVSSEACGLAARLAKALDARLTVLLAMAPVGAAGVGLSAESAAIVQQIERSRWTALQSTAEQLVADAQALLGTAVELRMADGDPVAALLVHARTADLLITAQRDPAGEGGLSTGQAARLLVGVGRPVLAVPHIGWAAAPRAVAPRSPLQRALVAWADTRESARALHDALPLLVRASHVELVSFAGSDAAEAQARSASLRDVAAHLARHGVTAVTTVLSTGEPTVGERMRRGWLPDVSVAEALLSHASDMQADFIVMGGYGHSRMWELALGGVTRTLLGTMTVPVLMSH